MGTGTQGEYSHTVRHLSAALRNVAERLLQPQTDVGYKKTNNLMDFI